MKFIKIILLIFWVACTALFIVGALTPLSFTHRFGLYFTFFVAFNGIFALSYLLTSFISLKASKVLFALVASLALILTYEFYLKFGSSWKTKEILYRHKNNPDDIIAFQRNGSGGLGNDFRTVKIITITPLFDWTTEMKKVEVNDEWREVNEHISELGTQAP